MFVLDFHTDTVSFMTARIQGVLSLVNGDCVDGLFSGEWNTGLKVVGTYTKLATDGCENKARKSQQ